MSSLDAMQAFKQLDCLDAFQDPISLLKVLAAHVPVGVQIYDSTGHSLFVNEQYIRTFGSPPPPEYCVLEDEIVKTMGGLHLIQKAFAGEITRFPAFWYDPRELKVNEAYTNKYGRRSAIETQLVPVLDRDSKVTYVIFFHRDVTAELFMQQERERALKERDDAKTLIQRVLDQTKAVIYIKDLEGRFIFVNGQFSRVFGLPPDGVLGKADHDLFPAEHADGFRKNDLHVQSTRSHLEIEETAVHCDGSAHTYLSLKFPLDDSAGKLVGVCGISTDVTQYRMLERELSTAKRFELVGLLAGGVAHNFNNLLGIILLAADTLLMKEGKGKPELRRAVESIKDAAQSASFLTRQLLAFGRQQNFQPSVLDLGTAVSGMKEILANALGEDIRFSAELTADAWPVFADPQHVEQVLVNLCLNARDAMPKGGELRVAVRNAKLGADQGNWRVGKPSGDFVELAIADTGCGMEPSVLDRIFEPFFTTKKEGRGTGLGLATVHGIMQGAGGEIAVESEPGKGSVFHIYFPRMHGEAVSRETRPEPGAETYAGSETILLVEDQGPLRQVTANLLRDHGYTVIEARDGPAALELWKVVSEKVDLIMTDIIMPGMSGVEMVRKLRLPSGRGLRVLFASAYSQEKLSEHDLDREAVHFIEKPYSAHGLFAKIREALGR
jgi:two-component system, cell cycle sensor histidine kinase and response regulator CckA